MDAKGAGVPLTWLTCYDFSFARALNSTELDLILVGDSGGMVSLGYSDTTPVTMNEMIHLSGAVRKGAPDKFIVGDMPKGSYEASNQDAINNAMRFIKETGCDAIKLEGGLRMASRVQAIVDSGIPVIGHIGLTPQSATAQGGYRVIGRGADESAQLMRDAESLQSAGAFGVLLEALPPSLSMKITSSFNFLVFGIGAGSHVDGQLLILYDLLGLYPNFRPKFAKCFVPQVSQIFSRSLPGSQELPDFGRNTRADGLYEITRLAVELFISETKSGLFPDEDYSYKDS
jgi:3-methyl-2-oxobutanoate hydroxymethyltransferase